MYTSHFPRQRSIAVLITSIVFFLLSYSESRAYTVTNFASEYHNGQIFITWTNASSSNLQYNVYRSATILTLSSQLTASNFLGFVRDNSSLNLFWSQESNVNTYYKITATSPPLASTKGLYVVTCTDNQSYYYVITVTNLSSGVEDKTILPGINSNLLPVTDIVAKPQPVFQDSVITHNDEVKKVYVQYVNNQETSLYPAMNSTGSYGFTFFLVKRGTATKFPLFILFEGFGNDATKSINLDSTYTNCYVMGVFDWLPLPTADGTIGDNDFFMGYHEHFNIYSNTGTIPTTGIVKTYSQKLYWEAIKWVESQVPVDTTKLYCKGISSSGYGALLTAAIHPEKIAAVYGILEPNSTSAADDIGKQMWGIASSHLKTDVVKWNTTDTLLFTDLKDMQKMINYNKLRSVPVIYDIHGKNDVSVPWNSGKITWYDSLENNHIGGTWYWDQRDHSGNGKNFTDEETEPDYYRFATNKSYPSFANCSINQDPGNGTPSNGDSYGALNGYLDWKDDNISDKSCNYTIHLFVKDLYVGGVIDPEQYSTCTADVTIRRYQKFAPPVGSTVKWSNYDDVTGVKIQHGSFTYDGGLVTIPGLIINKSSNKLKLSIKNCSSRIGDEDDDNDIDETTAAPVYFSPSPNGYIAHIDLTGDEQAIVCMFDLAGRKVWEKNASLVAGTNTMEIPSFGTGVFLVEVRSNTILCTNKLVF